MSDSGFRCCRRRTVGGLLRTPEGGIDYGQDFFRTPTFLNVSSQLQLECYACAGFRVYTIGSAFRLALRILSGVYYRANRDNSYFYLQASIMSFSFHDPMLCLRVIRPTSLTTHNLLAHCGMVCAA